MADSHLRIGIHCGSAVVGSFGGPMRSDYVAIGDTVNLALRIQSAAEPVGASSINSGGTRAGGAYQRKGAASAKVLDRLDL